MQKSDDTPRWAFMKWRDIGDGNTVYLRRIYILMTPLFSVMLHRIYRPDKQRDLHDHPWNFISIILRGWYRETIGDTVRQTERECRWINAKKAEDRHSISYTSRVPVWTLVFTGRRRRKWGFWVNETRWEMHGVDSLRATGSERWVPFDEYERLNDA